MTIESEIQLLSPSAIIELFSLDASKYAGGSVINFHAGTNKLQLPIVWQGVTYSPMPVEAEGFEVTGKGSLPRPKIRIANVDGLLSAEVNSRNDLVGCSLVRKRTFAKFLDAVNFPGGNANANSAQHFADDLWFVEQKVSETRYVIEWELSSALDLQGVMLPYRQVIKNSCVWKYKGSECGYAGANYYDSNDVPCISGLDFCGKRLTSCELRFGSGQMLPFGGFPGAVRYAF